MGAIRGVFGVKTALVGALCAFLIALVLSQPSSAADNMKVNSRLEYGVAADYCDNWAKGMVWLSNDTDNYYSEKVTASYNADSIDLEVRGAVNTCDTIMDPRKENRAIAGEVESKTTALKIDGTEFYRGSVPSGTTNAWSTKGSHLDATLNVKDVATCRGIAEIRTGTVRVEIYRKLIWEKIEFDGSKYRTEGGDGTEPIDIKIERSCPDVIRPKTTLLGGDLRVHGDIKTSVNSLDGTYYGSWVEYGVVASGSIRGIASGSGYVGGVKNTNGCKLHLLTLSNSKDSGSGCSESTLGQYKGLPSSPAGSIINVAKAYPKQKTTSGTQSVDALDAGTVYRATGDLSLTTSAALPKGKWVVINAENRTVRIDANLTYQNGALTSISDIPQLVIIAKNIIISDSVTRVDAWLIAPNGSIVTCDAPGINEPVQLTRGVCNKQLSVTGPVITNDLKLYRTYGALSVPGIHTPAEAFNLRADAYLWATAFGGASSSIRTTSIVDLPPRF